MSDGNAAGWSEGKFSDVLRHRKERGKPIDPLLSVTADRGIVPQEESGRRDISSDNKRAYWRVYPGDIVYNTMRMWQGVSACSEHFGIVSPAYTVCSPQDGVDSRFLAYVLKLPQHVAAFKNRSQGLVSDTWNLKYRRFANIPIRFPSRSDQLRIAEILDAVDKGIRSTERLLAMLEQVKQGLVHDLLTRGIDESGHLRDPHRRRDRFVETPLGLLPAAWDVQPIGALLASISPAMRSGPFGSALLKSELVQDGVPLLGIDNVETERFVKQYSRFVSDKKYRELARYAVRSGDVMVTIMGTVGRCCVVPDDIGRALSSKHVWTLTFDQERYLPELVCLQVNYSDWVLRHFARDTQGGIMSAIRSETLRTALLPVPPIREQRRISAVLRSGQARIDLASQELAKLSLLKQGLMHDLLTGSVRVSVEDEVLA